MNKNEIIELLSLKEITVTKTRISILEVLSSTEAFLTISQIVDKVKDLNKKSVYNNIKLMITKGLVDSFSFGGVPKYSLNDNLEGNNEIHLVSGQEIDHLDIDVKIFNDIRDSIKKETGKRVKAIKIFVDVE